MIETFFPTGGKKREALLVASSMFYAYGMITLAGILVARMLYPTDYAVKVLVFSIVNFGLALSDLGLSTAVMKLASEAGARKARKIASTGLALSLVSALVVFGSIFLLGGTFEKFYGSGLWGFIGLLCLANFLHQPAAIANAYWFARKRTRRAAGINLIYGTVYFIFTFGLTYFFRLKGVFYSVIAIYAIDVLVRLFGMGLSAPDWKLGKKLFGTGLLVAATSWITYALQNYDNLILGKVVSKESLAYYAVAYLPLFPLTLATLSLTYVVFPYLTESLRKKNGKVESLRLLNKTIKYSTLISACLGALIVVGFRLLTVFFLKRYYAANSYIAWMWIPFVLECGYSQPVSSYLVAAGRADSVLWARGIQLVLSVAMGLFLMINWGVWGAVGALWFSILVGAVCIQIAFRKTSARM
jgi:O-antigen/teichoic acid export membrane protein